MRLSERGNSWLGVFGPSAAIVAIYSETERWLLGVFYFELRAEGKG
jgi:hypothetical protein